jgi:O-methyltransferase
VGLGNRIRRLVRRVGFDVSRYPSVPPDLSPEVVATFHAVRPYTMSGSERVDALVRSVHWILDRRVPGDVVECGVWRGGSMMAVARTLLERGNCDRELYLFDTFAGMPEAGIDDHYLDGRPADSVLREELGPKASMADWCNSSIDEVRRNMALTGYPDDRIHFVKGMVEDTIPEQAPKQIALLRLDTDWYASTRHELEHLFPRLPPGGIVIIDDYGTWGGSQKAVDEHLATLRQPLMLHRVDSTARLIVVA